MKLPARGGLLREQKRKLETLLWDLEADPKQAAPQTDAEAEARMIGLLRQEMARCDAPSEQDTRLGLEPQS